MFNLTPNECRLLGVLIEKQLTTPEQYPLSLNQATNGANQKSNRDPVLSLDEEIIFDVLQSLRAKGLVARIDTPGSRVPKYRHLAHESFHVREGEQAILAELMLRGPQTLGELRGRADRMSTIDSLDIARGLISALMTREQPLVKQLPAEPGSRAEKYVHLLSSPVIELPPGASIDSSAMSLTSTNPPTDEIIPRLEALEKQVAHLADQLHRLASALGETLPANQDS